MQNINKEKRFFPCGTNDENRIIGATELENGLIILVKEDGTGYGSDGKMYQLHQALSQSEDILDERWIQIPE